jgi:DNA gyrase/topoisomerase IV subunit B
MQGICPHCNEHLEDKDPEGGIKILSFVEAVKKRPHFYSEEALAEMTHLTEEELKEIREIRESYYENTRELPCTTINVLTLEEAVRKRPSMYRNIENEGGHRLNDEQLEQIKEILKQMEKEEML